MIHALCSKGLDNVTSLLQHRIRIGRSLVAHLHRDFAVNVFFSRFARTMITVEFYGCVMTIDMAIEAFTSMLSDQQNNEDI
jgi:hypothetical protein